MKQKNAKYDTLNKQYVLYQHDQHNSLSNQFNDTKEQEWAKGHLPKAHQIHLWSSQSITHRTQFCIFIFFF